MTDIGRLKELEAKATKGIMAADRLDVIITTQTGDCWYAGFRSRPDATYHSELHNAAPHLLSEIETLRAQLAAAERVVEAARTHIMLEWGTLDAAMLGAKRYREGWGAIPDSEIALIESLAACDQGKVTICDSAPTEGE